MSQPTQTQFHPTHTRSTAKEANNMKTTLIALSLAVLALAACGTPAPMADESTLKVSMELAQPLDGGTAPSCVVSMNETCSFSQEAKSATSENVTVPGSLDFTVCTGTVNLVPICSAGWDLSPASELKVIVGKNGGTAKIILIRSATNQPPEVDIDLAPLTASADTGTASLKASTDALIPGTAGFVANPQTVTRDALVALVADTSAKKTNAIGLRNALSTGINQSQVGNPGRPAAQTALTNLDAELARADRELVKADAALNVNEPPKVEGTLKASALIAGQKAEGVLIKVGTNPTDQVTCTTSAAQKDCLWDLMPGTYSVVASKTGYVTQNSLITVVQYGVSTVQFNLPTTPANQPVAGDLVPIEDFVMAKGTTQSMAGTCRKYDASLQPVAIPDADCTFVVSGAGTTATVADKVITATQTTGGTRFKWTWNNGTPANLADDKFLEFTVMVY